MCRSSITVFKVQAILIRCFYICEFSYSLTSIGHPQVDASGISLGHSQTHAELPGVRVPAEGKQGNSVFLSHLLL